MLAYLPGVDRIGVPGAPPSFLPVASSATAGPVPSSGYAEEHRAVGLLDTAPGAVYRGGDPAPARPLLDILREPARRHPHTPAIDDGAVRHSYARLLAEVERLARRLSGAGVGPGDRVGVRLPSGTADLYVSILAVLAAGAAYVPVDVDDPDERAELVCDEAGVCAVLGPGPALTPRGTPGGANRPVTPDDDAWIIFTSGSTGRPKGV